MKHNFQTLILLFVMLMATTIGCERASQQMAPTIPVDSEESTVQLSLKEG